MVVERLSVHLTDLYRLTVSTSTLHYLSGQRTKYGPSSSSKVCRLSDRESHYVRKFCILCPKFLPKNQVKNVHLHHPVKNQFLKQKIIFLTTQRLWPPTPSLSKSAEKLTLDLGTFNSLQSDTTALS